MAFCINMTSTAKKISAIVSCYNGAKYLPAFLKNCSGQTVVNYLEIILVHNQPSADEINIVKNFQQKYPGLINHIIVPREPLAVSTNRAMKAAAGDYLCIWNVDDLRTENSLALMAATLDQNPSLGFTYGDYIMVSRWQSQAGKLINTPEFEKKEFAEGMHLGPFYMWRKQLCQTLGYWDEQFKSGADFDYAVRLAIESEGKKTQGLLGYYLDEGLGLSTGKTPYQPIERTVIELRYGMYHKLDFWYYARTKSYRLSEVLEGEKWKNINSLAPHRHLYARSRFWMVYTFVSYPFWVLKRAINKLKRLYFFR